MYCPSCGHQNEQEAKFCISCGKALAATDQAAPPPISTPYPIQPQSGRGVRILVLGILSVVFLGLFGGIPAWVMGNRDLKKIREGKIVADQKGLTMAGMVLGIIGTFVGNVALVIIIVTTTVMTFRVINKGNTQAGLEALSPAYAAKQPPLASYDNIEQIRGQTADDTPAVFLLQVSLGYDPADKEVSAEIGNHNREIQDLIRKDISQKTAAELSPSHYDEIQAELMQLINTIMKTGKVKSVMFRQFSVVK